MADDPTITKTPEQLEAIKKATGSMGEAFDKASKKAKELINIDFSKFGESALSSLSEMTNKMGDVGKSMFNLAAGPLKTLTDGLRDFGPAAGLLATDMGRNLINPIGNAGDAFAGLNNEIKAINDTVRNFLKVQSEARIASTLLGGSIEASDKAATKYPQSLRVAAAAFSLNTDEIHKMTEITRGVPGAIGEVSGKVFGLSAITKDAVMPTAVLATTMKAFGMTSNEAAQLGKRGWFEFGQTIPQVVQQSGLLAAASKSTGIDMGTTASQIIDASTSLAIFGQGTAVAANTWNTFASALRGSNVPINQIGDMVKQLTGSFANMGLQSKAFISTMSGMGGGRSAMGGALQMEMNLRTPGGLEKNMEMLTKSIANVAGGRIITLQEAATNPQLESQFIIQRQMLHKLTGITTQEQQNRILEVMQGVNSGGISSLEGSKALNDSFNKGQNIQEQTLTGIDKLGQTAAAAVDGLTNIDALITKLNTYMIRGNVSKEVFAESGGRRTHGLTGVAKGVRSSTNLRGAKQSVFSPQFKTAMGEFGNDLRGLSKILQDTTKSFKSSGADFVAGGSEFIRRLTGKEQFEKRGEATLPGKPTLQANITGQTAKLEESPVYKTLISLQKNDDNKLKVMDQILTALQQKNKEVVPPAEEISKVGGKKPTITTATGNDSTITIKIVGNEENTKQIHTIVKKALEDYGNSAIGKPTSR